MTVDLSSLLNTIVAGLASAGIIGLYKLGSLLTRLEARLEGHERIDDIRHTEVNRRIDHLERLD